MKKIYVIALLLCSMKVMSQEKPEFRINLYGGYAFDDEVGGYSSSTSYYESTVKGNFIWGLGVEYMFVPHVGFELTYMHEKTNAPTTYYNDDGNGNPVKNADIDLSINQIMLGPMFYFPGRE